MPLKQAPFRAYNLEEEKKKVDSFTIRLNKGERADLEKHKKFLNQKKDSTAMKQLASIGAIVIHDPKTAKILRVVVSNMAKNRRMGIVDFDE